jgi:hypothetical protein
MKHKQFLTKKIIVALLSLGWLVLPAATMAQAYGQGSYNETSYSTGVLSIGGISLPNTGATWAGIICILIAAVGGAILVYRHYRFNREA